MKRVLCVCLGNICRSPLAEGILKAKAEELLVNVGIASAGTAGYHVGHRADKRSENVGKRYNVDISNHKAQKFKVEHFDEFEIILVMDRMNYRDVSALARNKEDLNKIKLYLLEEDVEDPYYGEDDGFEKMYHILESKAEHWIRTALQ
jgi:protein-tyrosine phosphatase